MAPHLAKLATELQPKGVAFVSINADSENAASVYAFHRYFGLPYPATARPGHADRVVHATGRFGAGHVGVPPAVLPDVLRDIADRGRITFASEGAQPDALLRQELLQARP